jgi:hypothetical protein
MIDDWITTREAVEISGYHPDHLRRLIRAGDVEARKFGIVWQVSRQSLLSYLKDAQDSTDKRRGPHEE